MPEFPGFNQTFCSCANVGLLFLKPMPLVVLESDEGLRQLPSSLLIMISSA